MRETETERDRERQRDRESGTSEKNSFWACPYLKVSEWMDE